MTNITRNNFKFHPFNLVSPSPLSINTSLSLLVLTLLARPIPVIENELVQVDSEINRLNQVLNEASDAATFDRLNRRKTRCLNRLAGLEWEMDKAYRERGNNNNNNNRNKLLELTRKFLTFLVKRFLPSFTKCFLLLIPCILIYCLIDISLLVGTVTILKCNIVDLLNVEILTSLMAT